MMDPVLMLALGISLVLLLLLPWWQSAQDRRAEQLAQARPRWMQRASICYHETTCEVVCPMCEQTLETLAVSTTLQEVAALQECHETTACLSGRYGADRTRSVVPQSHEKAHPT